MTPINANPQTEEAEIPYPLSEFEAGRAQEMGLLQLCCGPFLCGCRGLACPVPAALASALVKRHSSLGKGSNMGVSVGILQ